MEKKKERRCILVCPRTIIECPGDGDGERNRIELKLTKYDGTNKEPEWDKGQRQLKRPDLDT